MDAHIYRQNANVKWLLLPELKTTPPEPLVSPSDLEDVTAGIIPEEIRIHPPTKIAALRRLRYDVHKSEKWTIHSDLSFPVGA